MLDRDPTASIQDKVNKLLTHWQELNYITDCQGKWYRRYISICSKMYRLVKIHKEGLPIRPPTYNQSKMFANIIKNVVGKSNRNIKNATQLVNKVQ